MKTKKKTTKTAAKARPKAKTTARRKAAPAKKITKPAARTRGEKACCDEEANRELGIEAAMPRRSAVRGAGGSTRGSNDWRPAKSLVTLRLQVNAKAPNRNKADDGMIGDLSHQNRSSDHNPWVDDGVVTAFDITNDPTNGCDVNAIAESIRAAKDARVKYLIWNRRIANSAPMGSEAAWAWRTFRGPNPHTKHMHISVKQSKALYDNTSPWAI